MEHNRKQCHKGLGQLGIYGYFSLYRDKGGEVMTISNLSVDAINAAILDLQKQINELKKKIEEKK